MQQHKLTGGVQIRFEDFAKASGVEREERHVYEMPRSRQPKKVVELSDDENSEDESDYLDSDVDSFEDEIKSHYQRIKEQKGLQIQVKSDS